MTFRCANRRKGRRLQLAAVDYLGDIRGEPPLPMRPVYLRRIDARVWLQRKTHRTLAVFGISALVAIYVVMLFSLTGR